MNYKFRAVIQKPKVPGYGGMIFHSCPSVHSSRKRGRKGLSRFSGRVEGRSNLSWRTAWRAYHDLCAITSLTNPRVLR